MACIKRALVLKLETERCDFRALEGWNEVGARDEKACGRERCGDYQRAASPERFLGCVLRWVVAAVG